MKTKILKEFDEKYVGNKIGKIYSWKSEAYTDCSGVRDFIKYIIAQTREETISEVEKMIKKEFQHQKLYCEAQDLRCEILEELNKLKK